MIIYLNNYKHCGVEYGDVSDSYFISQTSMTIRLFNISRSLAILIININFDSFTQENIEFISEYCLNIYITITLISKK